LQTHLAITRYKASFRKQRAVERLIMALVTTGSGAVLTYYWASDGLPLAGYSAMVVWILAIWSGSEALISAQHVWKDRATQRQERETSDDACDDDAQPAAETDN
jgi:hypothetical protein